MKETDNPKWYCLGMTIPFMGLSYLFDQKLESEDLRADFETITNYRDYANICVGLCLLTALGFFIKGSLEDKIKDE